MKEFSFRDRWQNIKQMKSKTFDLVIVGGGINGAGIARDAASRGMSVALLEGNDFASGTSSRSSKLVHGGIRYLENYEFGLVFEALSERAKLFTLAPHLVHPLRFMIPMFKGGRVGMGLMGLGMWLYDALALFETPEMHERLDLEETLQRVPFLRRADLLGAFEYSDAYMDDDRLVIETLRAAAEFGASVVNYVKAESLSKEGNSIYRLKVKDTQGNEAFEVCARHVISSVGPWTDDLGGRFSPDWKKVLRPTKGVHIVLDRNRFPISRAIVMGAESRIVFVIPRHEMLIIGTTDTDFKESPENVVTTAEDVRYLLSVFKDYFPEASVSSEDVISSYAGVRPLVHDGSASEGKTSREHTIWTGPSGVTFVAGGKYTTYRLIAEQAVEHALKTFDFESQVRYSRSRSLEPLNPNVLPEHIHFPERFEAPLLEQTRLSNNECRSLLQRHGGEAFVFPKKFGKQLRYWEYEAAHAIMNTMCYHLEDFFLRRTPLFLADASHGLNCLDEVASVFQGFLGWSNSERDEEVRRLQQRIQREFNWKSALD